MSPEDREVPPIPVPPVEPSPVAAVSLTKPLAPPEPPQPDPYVQPNPYAQPNPYVQPYVYANQAPVLPQGLSVASLICGIAGIVLGLMFLGFFPGLAAVITGHLAARRQPYARGFWLTGLITGYISVGLSILVAIGYIIFFVVLAAAGMASY